jgi:hypothetical protein
MTTMYISLMNSLSSGFRKWSDSHQPNHNDDEVGDPCPMPIAEPHVDDPAPIEEPPHHPWLVPGAGSSL